MLDFVWNLGSFIVALGILIAAHEYGHFYVARRCGVKVERFSIGFGKPIWSRIGKDGTEYTVAMIPLGGYVKMLDGRVDDISEDLKSQAFNEKSVYQRIAIVAAGPIANFIFAIIALYFMYLIGVPTIKPVIDGTLDNTPAAVISVKNPVQIKAVSGQNTRTWQEVNLAIASHIGEEQIVVTTAPLSMQAGTSANTKDYTLDIRNWSFDPEKESSIAAIGLQIYRPQVSPTFSQVSSDSAAESAGLQVGDTVVAYNGKRFDNWRSFVEVIQASAGEPLQVTVRRAGEQLSTTLVPKVHQNAQGKDIGIIGVVPTQEPWPEDVKLQLEYGLIDAGFAAADKTWQLIAVSLKMIGKLFTGDVSVKSLSGPISIAQGAGNSATFGLVYFLSFLALISVNLGIINLLPLPILDGGHLFYYFVEVITGRAVPEKVQEIGFKVGAALLLTLMSIALFNDFTRL